MVKVLVESLFLPFLACKVKIQERLWQHRVKTKYYHHRAFKHCDTALLKRYRDLSPYAISKSFMETKGASDVHVYGETPLQLYDQMAQRWQFQPHHRFVELGCGRGRGLFFLASVYGCHCEGIEWIPEFVHHAEGLHPRVHLYREDFMTSSHLHGDFLYLYGSCLEDAQVIKLCEKLLELPIESKIITVSFALDEYHESFVCSDQFTGVFPWGRGSIFLNARRG